MATETGGTADGGGFGGLGLLILCFLDFILIVVLMGAWAFQLKYVTAVQLGTAETLELTELNPYEETAKKPDDSSKNPTSTNPYNVTDSQDSTTSKVVTVIGVIVGIVFSALLTFGVYFL